MKRNKELVMMAVIVLMVFLYGCSTARESSSIESTSPQPQTAVDLRGPTGDVGQDLVVEGLSPAVGTEKLIFSYTVRENLDVQVAFENETAYDAVQLGLSLLNQFYEKETVPGVEEQAFFPEFFAMVNVETSDGLLYISEEEAVAFATDMYVEYQRKVMPPERANHLRKRQVVDQHLIPEATVKTQ